MTSALRQRPLLAAGLAVVALTLAATAGSLSADFVAWDDGITIYANPNLGDLSLDRLAWALTDTATTMRWIPLTLLSLVITHTIHGLDPFGYHLANWLLHGASSLAALLVLRELLGRAAARRGGGRDDAWVLVSAAAGALAWSLHPLRVEVEAWSNSRGHAQAGLLVFLALYAYLRGLREEAPRRGPFRAMALPAGLYLAALLCHPIAVGAAPIFVLLDLHLGRLGGAAGWWGPGPRRVVLEKLPFAAATLLVLAVTLLVRTFASGRWPAPVPLSEWGPFARAVQAGYAWVHYATVTLWPAGLQPAPTELIDFDPWTAPYLGRALLVVAVTGALLLARRRWPLGLHLWLAWLAWLVPALGLTEHPMFACDRYTYQAGLVPAAAVAGLLLWLGAEARRRAAAAAGAAVLVALLGGLTVQQTRVWRDSVALFEHMLPLLGDHPYRINIFVFLGIHQQNRGNHREAVAALSQAVTLEPLDGSLRSGLAISLLALGRRAEAVPHLEVALRFRPGDEALGCNLASSLMATGRPEEARTQALLVQARHPDSACAQDLLSRFRPAPPR